MEIFGDRLNPKYVFAILSPLRYGLLSMSVNREVPININASYVCELGAKYTLKSNYFMLIIELKRYFLIPGKKATIVHRIFSRMIILSLHLNQPLL